MTNVAFLSIPGLRPADVEQMPTLSAMAREGSTAPLTASFPCVTWPVQCNMLTGELPEAHGVVANGFYWRDEQRVEMWTAWNERIESPQIWDRLHQREPPVASAAWFPMLSKGSGADYICMPAPIHNPDGSESLWCYTRPTEMYGELRDALGHFPLQHFWGPLANIQSSAWIADSACYAARQHRPPFFYIYLPHLDYAAQKNGPNSTAATAALTALDDVIRRLIENLATAYAGQELVWIVASEYVITPVSHVTYPNRILREAGLLEVVAESEGEQLDFDRSRAWALVDHQFSHVFVAEADLRVAKQVADLFRGREGISEVLLGSERNKYHLGHPRAGEVVLVSAADSWQAYYWWQDDQQAPSYARTVDIHRKPGYDPVELHFDPATKSIPLDATLIRGSHGAPVQSDAQRGVILSSKPALLERPLRDIDVAAYVLKMIG